MSTMTEEETFDHVGVGPIESGVPMPRVGGFLGRLRLTLERLEVGNSVTLTNVTLKQEKYIRQQMPALGRELTAKYSVRVADHQRDRAAKRTLRVYRIE